VPEDCTREVLRGQVPELVRSLGLQFDGRSLDELLRGMPIGVRAVADERITVSGMSACVPPLDAGRPAIAP
jgi:hypothetical protein